MPEISNVFHRAAVPFHQVTGTLNDPDAFREITEWTEAARVVHELRDTRLGILGHYYNGMLDVYSDPTRVTTTFGTYVQHLEMSELAAHRKKVSEPEVTAKLQEFRTAFDVLGECSTAELERAARTACALDWVPWPIIMKGLQGRKKKISSPR
jgi:L-arabinose isomerase